MSCRKKYYFIIGLFLLFPTLRSKAQVSPSAISYSYNHLQWYTLEGDHFFIHYQEGSETTASAAAQIAHLIYEPITELYDFEPERKVSIVLRDREDYSNGAAYFFDNKIEIWVPPLDTPLRGTHPWLRNVITHEFIHIVQMGASMKRSPTLQSIYFQWLSYEDVRRPDVLYGSPKGIITHPFSTVSIPAWFSEGTAQFMRDSIFFDYWDTHRDMILRMNILDDSALSLEEMGDFSSKSSLEREMVYNQGFDFTKYLAEQYGEEVLAELSKKSSEGSNNFSEVLKSVTGKSGDEIYSGWINNRKHIYVQQVEEVTGVEPDIIVKNGFFNFYPQYDRQGKTFGYLTNKDRDYATTVLVLKTPDSTLVVDDIKNPDLESGQIMPEHHGYLSDISIDFIGNRFSFSPDGKKVTYSKADRNRYGEKYQDLFIFDIEKTKEQKITTDARTQDPAWHPSQDKITAVELDNGTQNLVLIDLKLKEKIDLTHFVNGETINTPVWSLDGRQIYFSSAYRGTRNLYRYDVELDRVEPLFEDPIIDFRDPWVDQKNEFLYFSSDSNGIFNIYRSDLKGQTIQRITNVKGGAFMPFAATDSLFFSDYRSDGYKISAIKLPEFIGTHNANQLMKESKNESHYLTENDVVESDNVFKTKYISDFSDSLKDIYPDENEVLLTSGYNDQSFVWRPYNQTTTGLSVIPVIRFDNYSKIYGSNSRLMTSGSFGDLGKNLIRDLKAGAYFSSRDVTERLSLFAGAMFGWGSIGSENLSDFFSPNRLNNLDRDLFLFIDHQGIPFIKRSWSPTISIELYNLKRNVRDGVAIEEFACTSCLPTQKSIDIRYNVWEANMFIRSKINRWSLLELGTSYSPYSVATDGFYSDEIRDFIPGSTTEYFKGSSYSASYIANTIIPSRNSDIAPEGARGSATFRLEKGRLLQEFEINEGTLSPIYNRKTNMSIELQSQLGGNIMGDLNGLLKTRIFGYFNKPEDYFYLDYTGGLSGMRSYPYFAIGGQRTVWGRFSLLTPIKRNINKQFGAYTLDKLYGNIFLEAGNGWGGPLNIGNNLKTGIGAELRLALNSYYIFPLKLFVNSTYGFNQFNVTLPAQFISTSAGNSVTYGKELLFYFGLTFDFNQL